MKLYADSEFPVSDAIAAVHTHQFQGVVAAGTWGNGAQRRSVAVETRRACYEAGLLEPPAVGAEEADLQLPESTRRVIGTIATSVRDLNKDFCDEAIGSGLSDAEYVEIVGIVSRLVDMDVFARGIGVLPRELPPAEAGEPSKQRPDAAVMELAWVPTIPNGPAGGEIGEALYHGMPMPYIVRALSLVPDELRAHVELEIAHYTRLDKLFDYDYQHHDGLTRPQAEVVAGRVSALNDCFY
jgi:hypothetical protein